jgi:hypothetical protein
MLDIQAVSLTTDYLILKKIKEDMLFSTQLRLKLEALKEFQNDPVFGSFITSIVAYTQGTELTKQVMLTGRGYNAPRSYTIEGLTDIFKKKDFRFSKAGRGFSPLRSRCQRTTMGVRPCTG